MSTPPLFLIDSLGDHLAPLGNGDQLALTGEEGHHAARVRRLGPGEALLIGDGLGTLLHCTVTRIRPDGLEVTISSRVAHPSPSPRLVLVQALPKGDRAELAVELATELGVDEIVPWAAARCVTQWSGARGERAHARWVRTAREAAKQSRRAWVPEVAELVTTARLVERTRRTRTLVLEGSATEALATAPLPDAGDIVIIVGPEGGISDEEVQRLTDAGAAGVRLGEPVLRTSTAGPAALSALSLRLGRWG